MRINKHANKRNSLYSSISDSFSSLLKLLLCPLLVFTWLNIKMNTDTRKLKIKQSYVKIYLKSKSNQQHSQFLVFKENIQKLLERNRKSKFKFNNIRPLSIRAVLHRFLASSSKSTNLTTSLLRVRNLFPSSPNTRPNPTWLTLGYLSASAGSQPARLAA